jgi:DNA-binding NtrC family response regulator
MMKMRDNHNRMKPLSVLLIDGQPEMRERISTLLSPGGHDVVTAASGPEALDRFREKAFGLVISEFNVPKMDGMTVLEQLKKIAPEIPVIITETNGIIDNAVKTMQRGASDYLLKPVSSDALALAIKRAVGDANGGRPGRVAAGNGGGIAKQGEVITQSSKMQHVLRIAKKVAPSNATVLIQGESGTGKEVLAGFIHQHSLLKENPYVAVNCASLPENLAESELFGHEKGAFTGAVSRKMGKFELANRGTIVLDEISEMPLPTQAKLLRIIQERVLDRVGGTKPVPIQVRVIAISNVDLKKAVQEGRFREDLFFRINVIPLEIPPLRDRKEDIPLLANHFLKKYERENGKQGMTLADAALAALMKLDWAGNVRELENTIYRAVLLSEGQVIPADNLVLTEDRVENDDVDSIGVGLSVREMERKLIFATLDQLNHNRTHAAEMLGISIRTLRNKLKEYKEECGN